MTAVLAREAFGAEFVGADGFLNTPTYGLPPRFLIDALRDCIGQWQTGTMEVPVFDDYVRSLTDKGITDPYDSLSEREREVLQLVAEGRSSKEVAELLSISPATVETHRAHILQKLQLHNTVEVVRYATRRGIIQ